MALVLVALVAGAPPGLGATLDPDSFSGSGLHNELSVQALFRGEFEKVDFNREDLEFAVLFQQYLNEYAVKCVAHLPANKVEMTESQCAMEEVTRNGFGVEISRACVRYVDVGTGLYAKPDLYAAMQEIDRLVAADRLRQSWRLITTMTESNSLDGMASMTAMALEAQSDMKAVVQNNACAGAGLKRFEENLRRFALNDEGIRLDGSRGVPVAVSEAWSAFTSDDYARLIDELITDQSRTWALNRYMRGSVFGVSVSAPDGSPSRVAASYSFDGFNGRSRGSVELTFTGGRPVCLEFWDAPGVCRTPSRSIVAEHVDRVRTRPATEPTAEPKLAAEPAVETVASSPAERSPAPPAERITSRRAGAAPEPGATPERGSTPKRGAAAEPEAMAESEVTEQPQIAAGSSAPPPPRRVLTAVNYVQGIKDACLEVLTGGERREPETSYCFCLSASVGAMLVPKHDVRWFFENFSEAASAELERRHPVLARPFASCRAQRDAKSSD